MVRDPASLVKHELLEVLLHDIKPLTEGALPRLLENIKATGRMRIANPPPVPTPLVYQAAAFQHAMHVVDACKRLGTIAKYAKLLPPRTTLARYGATEDEWFEYHFLNYITTVVGIYDMALILTNTIFGLGLPPDRCSRDTIQRNARLHGSATKRALDEIEKIVRSHKQTRNTYLHRGEIPVIEPIDHLKPYLLINGSGSNVVPASTLRRLFRTAAREAFVPLEELGTSLLEAVELLFDAVLQAYRLRRLSASRVRI